MADANLEAKIRAALSEIIIPGGETLAEFSGLSDIIITTNAIAFAISAPEGMEKAFGPTRSQAQSAVDALSENRKVMITLTTGKAPAQAAPKAKRPAPAAKTRVAGIKHIIAVGSGKGGVGKSTCAVNLAIAFAQLGLKTGILDADIYGPSLPKMLGLEGTPALREDGIFRAFDAYGVKAMSIGPMLEGNQAVVWRGPMATSALRQLLRETEWGDLDVLVIDLPPGTGDIQISLVQSTELTGAVIVSTPQDMSLIDAKKAIDMFARVRVPILGIVENMSYFIAPDTGNRYDIFGHGGAKQAAQDYGINFLGEVPLVMSIREGADAGKPTVAVHPTGAEAQAFAAIAKSLLPNIQ